MEEFKKNFERYFVKNDGCWEWLGGKHVNGYGTLQSNEAIELFKTSYAHRISYHLYKSDPGKQQVHHSCDNPPCINPDHLSLGDQAKNNKERDERGRQRTSHGADSNFAKLTLEQVNEIRRLALTGKTYVELAAQFQIHKKTAREICIGKTWQLPNLEPEFARQKKELDDRIITMYRSGKYSMRKLHEEVGRSISYISGILPRE
jgi:hypothetical protein